jgi:Tol biopolymer transport system component
MRAVAVLIVVAVMPATGAGSLGGAAAAPQRSARAAFPGAAAPSWSPDGKQIAFADVHGAQSGRYRIVHTSSRPGGAVLTVLAAPHSTWGCCYQMLWGPGSRILVDPSGGLKAVNVLGGKPKQISFPGCSLTPCSPRSFILSSNRQYAAVTTMDGGSVHCCAGIQLLRLRPKRAPAVLRTRLSDPDWVLAFSPDGKQLVFGSCRLADPTDPGACDGYEQMAIRIPGGTPVPLAQSGIRGAALVPPYVRQLQWSPDGRWVAYVESGSDSLEVAPTTGATAPRILSTCASDFSWSPTSKLIAIDCAAQPNADSQLSTVRPDGTHLTDLLEDRPLTYLPRQQEGGPQWSPDGSRLLILAQAPGHRTVRVWSIRANGSHLTRLG